MRVGIIGAAGQVGSEFVKRLPAGDLVLWDRKILDICVPEQIDDVLGDSECDVVVNLAAFHNTNACEKEQTKAYAVNATGAYNVAKAAAEYGLKLVHISTDYVFGQDEDRSVPYVESSRVGPINVYGASKVAGEQMVRASCSNHLIVRTSSLFGVTTSGKGWTFPEMIVNNARAGKPLKVVTDQVMSPTYTYDLVAKILELLEKGATETVHVSNGGECSWHEFASRTLEVVGMDYPIAECTSDAFPSPARRPSYSAMSSERMENVGVESMRHWADALESYVKEKGWLP